MSGLILRFEPPRASGHGDASTTVALELAKKLSKKPAEIAEFLAQALKKCAFVEKAEVAGAGYVNVWLTPAALLAELNQSRSAHVAKVTRKNERPVIVEYSQPNIAKPLGIHHILSTIIGQSLSNLHRYLGYNVVAINHLGDWGTQFGKLAVAMRRWGKKSADQSSLSEFLALYVRFHEEAEKDTTLEDEAREEFLKLEKGDAALRSFWAIVVKRTMSEVEEVYHRLGVTFDHVHGESFYEDKMAPILEEGRKKKVFVEGEKGALIARFPEATGMPPAIVLKGDGSTIYHTRDLATIRYRVDRWHPEAILYVVDVAQLLYFQQLLDMVRQLGWELPHLEHVVIGRMSFADRTMSTRKGSILLLRDVLDEAVVRAKAIVAERGDAIQTDDPGELAEMMGIGAVVYGILSQNRTHDIVFDWNTMLSFEGNSAPYLQYTHARARSVLRKAADAGIAFDGSIAIASLTESERLLIRALLLFPEVLADALAKYMPHTIANYLYALCQAFNSFYNKEPILKSGEPHRSLRLRLTADAAAVLHAGASLLTLRLPDRM